MTSADASQAPAGIDVSRYGGSDRYATSLLVAEAVATHAGGSLDTVVMVSGRNWYGDDCFSEGRVGLARARVPFDSFSAGPLLALLCAPLLLTHPKKIPDATAAYLDQVRQSAAASDGASIDLRIFGGDAAVSQAAIDEYLRP